MIRRHPVAVACLAFLAIAAYIIIVGFERPPITSVQRGYRGTGMVQVYNPRAVAEQATYNQPPELVPPVDPGSPLSKEVYENVPILGDLPSDEFNRLMVAITNWVSPVQGCAYCHGEEGDFATDHLYTKVVARRMIQMTQRINNDWKTHVGATGVVCYTCHRGQNVPAKVWFSDSGPPTAQGVVGNRGGQNLASPAVGLTSLPYDPFSHFLERAADIRVVGKTALPEGNLHSIKQTEGTYGLMVHMSESLGVNCTYCHNTRSFMSWDQSQPARSSAWYGIRMVRELNTDYLEPLGAQYPVVRLGPQGDAPKANCATCHQGAFKPLYGAPILKDYHGLGGAASMAAAPGPTKAAVDAHSSPAVVAQTAP